MRGKAGIEGTQKKARVNPSTRPLGRLRSLLHHVAPPPTSNRPSAAHTKPTTRRQLLISSLDFNASRSSTRAPETPLEAARTLEMPLKVAALLCLLALVRQTLAVSAHSPRDLEAFPAYQVLLNERAVLNETVPGLLEEPLAVRALAVPLPERRRADTPHRRHRLTRTLRGGTYCARPMAKHSSAPCQPSPTSRRSGQTRGQRRMRSCGPRSGRRASRMDWRCSSRCELVACT